MYGDSIKPIENNNAQPNNNSYFINNKFLGKPVAFEGLVLDYFEKPSVVSEYHVQCVDCSANWSVTTAQIEIDNISPLSVTLVGDRINNNTNVTLSLTSYQSFYMPQSHTGHSCSWISAVSPTPWIYIQGTEV